MKRTGAAVVAVAAFCAGFALAPALAAPPTVTPSPGYDARLQEQRAASAAKVHQPVLAAPVSRRHGKRTRKQ
jgi:hypothetical protein